MPRPFLSDNEELKVRKRRIEQLTRGELLGKAARDAVQAAQAAVMVACVTPAITVATVTS